MYLANVIVSKEHIWLEFLEWKSARTNECAGQSKWCFPEPVAYRLCHRGCQSWTGILLAVPEDDVVSYCSWTLKWTLASYCKLCSGMLVAAVYVREDKHTEESIPWNYIWVILKRLTSRRHPPHSFCAKCLFYFCPMHTTHVEGYKTWQACSAKSWHDWQQLFREGFLWTVNCFVESFQCFQNALCLPSLA